MLHVLQVLQIQQTRLWTWLEGEEDETEEEEEDETSHGKKQVPGALQKPKQEEGHSEDNPEDPVLPEKGSPSFVKAARSIMLEVKHEPQTMAEKKKRKLEEQSPPKVPPKKSEAEMPKKKKDKDKAPRGNVSFAIAGKGPQKSISAAPTRAEKFVHEGRYDRDLDTMQRILDTDFNASSGRLVVHYKDCLSEEPKSRREISLAVLLHTSVRALSVQSVLRCRTKNAQSAAAAREYFEKRYPSSSPRQVAEGILKGLSVCTGCAAAPQWPVDLSPPSECIGPAKLKMEGLRSGRGGGRANRVIAMGIEDIVDMETDVLQVLRTASVVLLPRSAARHARPARSARSMRLLLACLWRTIPVCRFLQEKFVRFVRMAGLMACKLEEERNLGLTASGAWLLVRTRELAQCGHQHGE